ncbi:MAG: ATPase [bacterium]|nr:MAG: ATPase [bacterium]
MKFINRNTELKSLNDKWAEKKSHFVIIYGKRRVGKTELIKQFIKDKPAVYFLADKRTELEQLSELGRIMGHFFNDSLLDARGFNSWLEVFRYLKERSKNRLIFVIDEYPYLVETNKAMSSIFQKGWDEILKGLNIFLILSGSSISMMESEVLIHKSPLYGRRTGQVLIKPLSFRKSWDFFPDKDFDEFLSIYTITGGMPAYLLQWDSALSIEENISNKIIIKAISWGKRKFSEIANETGLEKNILTKYLTTLERLQVIEKEVPVTEKSPLKSRKGLYLISDNFFRFWFQYIFPYKSDLEIERFDEVLRKIKESFKNLEAIVYEKVCKEIVWDFMDKIFRFERVGKWWEKEKEIDLVALNWQTKNILFGEVKCSAKEIGTNIFEALKQKAQYVQWQKDGRKDYYLLCSKNGFTKDMLNLARNKNIFLIHKDKLVE